MELSGHVTGTVTVAVTLYIVAAWLPLVNLKLYPPEIQSPGAMCRSPSMLEGPMLKDLPPPVVPPQVKVPDDDRGSVLRVVTFPELSTSVNVAEPDTL
jgi:hypothetical protein